jgi:hypothetical protein
MDQEAMRQLHVAIAHLVTHHGSQIITDLEFAAAVAKEAQAFKDKDLSGLLDYNTGLRY